MQSSKHVVPETISRRSESPARIKEEKIMSYYVHQIPGRLRLRIPELKKNPRIARDIQELLEDLPGINSSSANTVTGSIIAHYDPQLINAEAIINVLAREEYIDVTKVFSNTKLNDNTIATLTQVASRAVLGIVLDRALQGTPFSIVAAFI